jgi:hypothetical protein
MEVQVVEIRFTVPELETEDMENIDFEKHLGQEISKLASGSDGQS